MSEPEKLSFIDATRAIAVLMVIAVHSAQLSPASPLTNKIFAFGQMGVQLFFFASALTLCLSAAHRIDEANGTIKFYIRRFFRIAPMYYLGIVIFFWWSANMSQLSIGPFPSADHYTYKNVLANVLLIHGFYIPANNNIVPGGWSIGTEVAFYALFPVLYCFMSKLKNKYIVLLASIGISISVLPIFQSKFAIPMANNSFFYFNILNQINVFIIGMLYYFDFYGKPLTAKSASALFVVFGFIAISMWNNGLFLFVTIFFAITFIGLVELLRKAPEKFILALRPIGKYSFSMYIVHIAVLFSLNAFVVGKYELHQFIEKNVLLFLFFSASVLLSFSIAKIFYVLVERPMVAFGRNLIVMFSGKLSIA